MALAWMFLATLTGAAAASPAPAAASDEMAILDAYLAQFDKPVYVADEEAPSPIVDRCHRHGGQEDVARLPLGAGAAATNDLMFQHSEWHGERGRFTEPVFTWSDSDPYGRHFIEYHADLLRTYVDWRAANGHAPLAPWDPMTPIPDSLAYPVEPPCRARESNDPRIPLPTFLTVEGGTDGSPFWGYTALCDIPDLNRLGKTIEGSWYHADVHLTIGGDMAEAALTLRDPVFWPWHAHVQGIVETWQACQALEVEGDGARETRETPGLALPGALTALAVVACFRKR